MMRSRFGAAAPARGAAGLLLAVLLAACSDPTLSEPTGPVPGEPPASTPENPGTPAPPATVDPAPAPEPPPAPEPAPESPAANPFAGARLYVDPEAPSLETAAQWRTSRPADADVMQRLAAVPQAIWLAEWSGNVQTAAARLVSDARAQGAMAVIVAYNITNRDCGAYSAGGVAASAYRSWVRSLAAGIGNAKAIVILEPDALADLDCMSGAARQERIDLLRDAVEVLKRQPAVSVYIDAGNARWVGVSEIAARLKLVGVDRADGFALNVSNFLTNAENVSYGSAISQLIGGKHFVIDTSRNGQGPTADLQWCNPKGRGLGVQPTTRSGHPLVDALLWVKRPGESDGACNGGPHAGDWWPEYALGLASRATTATALN